MSLTQVIEQHLEDPEELEKIYRNTPELFADSFDDAFHSNPDSKVLEVWQARLRYETSLKSKTQLFVMDNLREIMLIVVLALVGGTLARIPIMFDGINSEAFYQRFASFFVLPSLAAYFLFKHKQVSSNLLAGIGLIFVGACIYMGTLPNDSTGQTLDLASLHVPFLLWALVGVAFAGNTYRSLTPRLDYIKFNGELLIFTILTLLGGAAMTGITIGLFHTIGLDIGQWYGENIVAYGLVAAPTVAAYITMQRTFNGQRLAPTFARIFGPLALITLVVFLIANGIQGKSPFTDRDFLIVFNIMLMAVLAITVFTISERPAQNVVTASDYIAVALVMVALVVDLVALSAIVFRLSSYGITPNRIAVLGANLLVFGNLAGIAIYYGGFLKGAMPVQQLENWIARYLPVYAAWTAFVVFILPLLFRMF